MKKKYSQMTEQELWEELADVNEKSKKAEQLGNPSEFAVYEQKRIMAEAYLLNPDDFMSGQRYSLKQEAGTFFVKYYNGVFAWGYREQSDKLEALPISLLGSITQSSI
ncbi:YfhH family protein [Salibacterium aidingense]|uniref:YfhH family protein n=1 Tax=Salibacterium aidingense TaxID=384933 RepID=UPI0003F7DFC0|nr:YfhH family protein [Salibacterium aidingense]